MVSRNAEQLRKRWGQQVRKARLANQLTQEQLAAAIGVGQNTISRVETGQHAPSDGLKFRLAQALHRSPDELFAYPMHVAPEPLERPA